MIILLNFPPREFIIMEDGSDLLMEILEHTCQHSDHNDLRKKEEQLNNSDKMKFCIYCGIRLPIDAVFAKKVGKRIIERLYTLG